MRDAYALLDDVFSTAGKRLANAVEMLGYPNGNRDAVIPENNLLIYVANELTKHGFVLYCEAALSDKSEKSPPPTN